MSEKEEAEKAYLEIQERFTSNLQVLQRVTQQERSTNVAKQRLELVLTELKALPQDTPTFKQIGRAYFLQPMSSILSDGTESIAEATTEIEALKQKRTTLEEKLMETRKELRELATTERLDAEDSADNSD